MDQRRFQEEENAEKREVGGPVTAFFLSNLTFEIIDSPIGDIFNGFPIWNTTTPISICISRSVS